MPSQPLNSAAVFRGRVEQIIQVAGGQKRMIATRQLQLPFPPHPGLVLYFDTPDGQHCVNIDLIEYFTVAGTFVWRVKTENMSEEDAVQQAADYEKAGFNVQWD